MRLLAAATVHFSQDAAEAKPEAGQHQDEIDGGVDQEAPRESQSCAGKK